MNSQTITSSSNNNKNTVCLCVCVFLFSILLFLTYFPSVCVPPQDINTTTCVATDGVQEFADEDNTDFETVFVLADFDCPEYGYLYKRDHRIVGPPVVLHCAAKEEVCL